MKYLKTKLILALICAAIGAGGDLMAIQANDLERVASASYKAGLEAADNEAFAVHVHFARQLQHEQHKPVKVIAKAKTTKRTPNVFETAGLQ